MKKSTDLFVYFLYKKFAFRLKMKADFFGIFGHFDQKSKNEMSNKKKYFVESFFSKNLHLGCYATVCSKSEVTLKYLGTIHILRQHNFGLFLTPAYPHPLCNHKYSTERQQNWPFSRPTHPVPC